MTFQVKKVIVALLSVIVLLSGIFVFGAGSVAAQSAPWQAEYFSNPYLQGNPVVVRSEADINNYWGHTAPFTTLPADGFSVRWTRTVDYVSAGTYRFVATVDDGMRIFLNGQPVLDSWYASTVHTVSQDVSIPVAGRQTVIVEYFEQAGEATAVVDIYQLSSGGSDGGFGGGIGGGQVGGGDGGDPSGAFPNWKGQYFNNLAQSGEPIVVRDDRYLDFSWGSDSPFPGLIPPNDFSVRWTRSTYIPYGHYIVTLTSDDGTRLWLNGQLIINNYVNPSLQPQTVEVWSPGDTANVRVDFYDRSQTAAVKLDIQQVPNSPGSNSSFVVPGAPGGAGISGGFPGSGGGGTVQAIPQCPGVPYPTGFNAVVTSASNLNIRRSPTTLSETMGQVPSCGTVPLTGVRDPLGQWVLTFYQGQIGWMSVEHLVLGSPISSFSPPGG